jgi:hypothetical protein
LSEDTEPNETAGLSEVTEPNETAGFSEVTDPNETAGFSEVTDPNETAVFSCEVLDPNEIVGFSAVLDPNDPNELVMNLTGSDDVDDFNPKLILDVLAEAGTSVENFVFVAVLSLGSLLVRQHAHSALSASLETKQVEQVHLDELEDRLLNGFVSLGASNLLDESV